MRAEHRDADAADLAIEELYAGHYTRLVRLAVLLLRDQGLAEEIVQDAFIAVHARWHALRDQDKALAYLRQTVVNRSRSALRHRKVVAKHTPRTLPDAPGADQAVLDSARRQRVLDAMSKLPTRQREVLALRYYLDQTEHQIAETLGISAGAVKSHASRGAANLRTLLADEKLADEHEDER